MKLRFLRIVYTVICLAVAMGMNAKAQGRGPGGPAPGGPHPGGFGMGGPGGAANSGPNGYHATGAAHQGSSPAVSTATHSNLVFGPVGRWWDDKAVVLAIGLSQDQQKKMDAIFSANKPAIVGSYKTFLREQSKLDTLSKNPQAGQTQLFSAIDAVSQARAALQKATTQMLLQIRQQMNSEQIAKLEKLQ